jgi:hypothetical protein
VINIRTEYTECRKYDPDTDSWVRVEPEEAWRVLSYQKARLIEEDDRDTYTIRCNKWLYKLRKPSRT